MRQRVALQRHGFTLAELIIAMASSTLLVAGMGSAIFIAIQAAEEDTVAGETIEGSLLADEIAEDVRAAVGFRERTANAITFSVADRNGDGYPEVIRYSWSGTAGDPLYRTQNGTQVEIADSVASLTFNYITETRPIIGRALFIWGTNGSNSETRDAQRISAIEGWGYEVISVPDSTSQAEFDWLSALVDIAYVSETTQSTNLNTKIKAKAIGVLCEEGSLHDDNNGFAFTNSDGGGYNASEINIVDNGHYITSQFAQGSLTIGSSSLKLRRVTSATSIGFQTLSRRVGSTDPVLGTVNTGERLYDNSLAAGPRVLLPWGNTDFDSTNLNSDGLALWQRALDWAARKYVVSSVAITLQLGDTSGTSVSTEVDVLSRPQA